MNYEENILLVKMVAGALPHHLSSETYKDQAGLQNKPMRQ
jgi:hypothetical protein